MPKNVKLKMHNKLMKAKEVYKSAPTSGKSKVVDSKGGKPSMKSIDLQLMQMRERQLRQGKVNVAGKAAVKAKPIELQPSILALSRQAAMEPVPTLSLTDMLLQGEASVTVKDTQGRVGSSMMMDDDDENHRRKANMFADLSDDDDDEGSKYQLKLQPSLLQNCRYAG